MESKSVARSLDYILLNRKKFLGAYCVQFVCGKAYDRIFEVGQITEIYGNDTAFTMKVDGNAWLLYLWDSICLPKVTEDDNNIVVEDNVLDLKFIILKLDKPK